jgi:hypothetical protein
MRYASSFNRPPIYFIENIRQHVRETSQHDPQKDLHMDTFHPCVKAWLFLDDVTDRNGPFNYVPGSHKLTWARIKWEYGQSFIASTPDRENGNRYWDGAFRVSLGDLKEMGYPKPISLEVPANTLVIANVRGFHCRGEATQSRHRRSIWMQGRDNPFFPLFTPFPKLTGHIVESLWSHFLEKENLRYPESRPSFFGKFGWDGECYLLWANPTSPNSCRILGPLTC